MRDWIEKLTEGAGLGADEAESAFHTIMQGEASEVEIAAFLAALRARGETPEEVAGGVRALRRVMVEAPLEGDGIVDTCGTGGGSLTTFNISTVAAFVTAGAGVPVAKHGNRSFTSLCGSADVLETLGVEIELGPEALSQVFDAAGIAFMYAPRYHPAMRHVASVRRELGVSTIMNVLGPLTSPARVRRQVVGVAEPDLVPLVAGALRALGHERALVVHGEPGMDELSPLGTTRGMRLDDGELEPFEVTPSELGWDDLAASDLAGGAPEANAATAVRILEGKGSEAAEAAVLINAAAAIYVGGRADDLEGGLERARASLADGAALGALEALRDASRRVSGSGSGA